MKKQDKLNSQLNNILDLIDGVIQCQKETILILKRVVDRLNQLTNK